MSKKSILSIIHGVTHSGNAATSAVEGLSVAHNVSHAVNTGSSYIAPTPTYAPVSTSPSGSSSSTSAAAQAQARRQRQAKQAKAVHQRNRKARKSRSGQTLKATKLVLKEKAKLTPKENKATAPVVAKALKVTPLKQKPVNGPENTENLRPRVAATPAQIPYPKSGPSGAYEGTAAVNQVLRMTKAKPPAKQAKSTPAKSTRTQPRSASKAPKVATRLEKAVKKSTGSVPDYVPSEYAGLITKASRKSKVPAPLLSALLQQESGFQAHIGSPAGAQGIAQFMPATAASRGVDANDPKSAIPGAAELLRENKDQFGSWGKALAAYNAGGGAVSEYGGIPPYPETQNYVKTIKSNAGDTSGAAKTVPKKLKQTAKQTLGKAPTRAILKGGRVVKDPKAGEKTKSEFTGRYAGSQDVVRTLVGTKVKGDHGGTKNGEAPGVHTPDGDHYRDDGYAQDINGDNPSENEPAYDQATLDRIVANIKKTGYEGPDPTGLKIGENWEGSVGGYAVQVLTNEGGTINHIHVGAHPDGSDPTVTDTNVPIKGTNLAVKLPTKPSTGSGAVTSGTSAGSAATTTTSTSETAKTAKGRKARRRPMRRRPTYADSTEGYYSVDPDTYRADPFLAKLAALTK